MSRQPRTSGHFRTGYAQDLKLIQTRAEAAALVALLVGLAAFPFLASVFLLDLANQVLLASIGALALMLLTGYAGQVSLGHAGLMAAGAFTVGILSKEMQAPFWVTLPAAILVGGLLGVVFGLPSLRLRGLYLAVSTLALHFLVIYLGGEYESKRGYSTGIVDRAALSRWAAPSPAAAPGISSWAGLPRQHSCSASTCCAAARGARGPRFAARKRWRRPWG